MIDVNAMFEAEIERLRDELYRYSYKNQRLRAALAWYADESNWAKDSTIHEPVFIAERCGGERARQALRGEK